jgi:hypothetical protein
MSRKRLAVLGMPLLAIGALITAAAVQPDPASRVAIDQAKAKAWVVTQRANLPKSLAAYGPLSKIYKKAVLAELSISEQRNLWREHLETFLTPAEKQSPMQQEMVKALGAPLTAPQLGLIRAAVDSLNRIFDSSLTLPQRRAVASVFCDSAKVLFTKAQAGMIFGNIGLHDTAYDRQIGGVTRQPTMILAGLGTDLVAAVRTLAVKVHLLTPTTPRGTCLCNYNSLCDCGTDSCASTGGCNGSDSGCGCFGIWACNANCLLG